MRYLFPVLACQLVTEGSFDGVGLFVVLKNKGVARRVQFLQGRAALEARFLIELPEKFSVIILQSVKFRIFVLAIGDSSTSRISVMTA